MSRGVEIMILKSLRLLLVAARSDRLPALAAQIDEQIAKIDLDLHPPPLPSIMNERGGREA